MIGWRWRGSSCLAAHCAKIHLRRKINAYDNDGNNCRPAEKISTKWNKCKAPGSQGPCNIYKKHQWSYFLFIITFLLNILYFIIPTKTQSSPPPKKRRTKTTHHTKIHTSVWLGINCFHAEVLRYGSHQGDAWGQLLKWWGNFPNKPMGFSLLPKWINLSGWWDWGETHHLRKHP